MTSTEKGDLEINHVFADSIAHFCGCERSQNWSFFFGLHKCMTHYQNYLLISYCIFDNIEICNV